MDLSNVPTCELVEELKKREGVNTLVANPNMMYEVHVDDENGSYEEDEGPAIILIVTD